MRHTYAFHILPVIAVPKTAQIYSSIDVCFITKYIFRPLVQYHCKVLAEDTSGSAAWLPGQMDVPCKFSITTKY